MDENIKTRRRLCAERIIWFWTFLLFMSTSLLGQYLWGKYVLVVTILLIAATVLWEKRGRLGVRFDAYQSFSLIFIVYMAYNALWAIIPSVPLLGVRMWFGATFGASVLYWYFRGDNIGLLLSALKWAGYGITIYVIFFFGVDAIKEATTSTRLTKDVANVNVIGMALAVSCLIQVFNVVFKKEPFWTLALMAPSIWVIAATQSRKAFVFVGLGILGVFLIKNALVNKNLVRAIGKVIASAALVGLVLFFCGKTALFEGMNKRMSGVTNLVTGQGEVDDSSAARKAMIDFGWEHFKQHPIGGVGLGCPRYLLLKYWNVETYLHNNYIELLCGGGILAAIIYYSIFVYIIVALFKYRNADHAYFTIGIVWIALMLTMDLAMVTYSSERQRLFLMIHCLNIEYLKQKYYLM